MRCVEQSTPGLANYPFATGDAVALADLRRAYAAVMLVYEPYAPEFLSMKPRKAASVFGLT